MEICNNCKTLIFEISFGMNLPFVTDGPVYFCKNCCPPATSEEIIAQIENFIDPIKEF